MGRKVLIVGGVAGGASAAARMRRLDEEAEIILFEKDSYISFANCGLPYYIGETIKERSRLVVQTPEVMRARYNMDVRINSEVTKVDTGRKTVTVRSAADGTYEENYDILILSPGARALKPNIPGINSKRIFTLRNIPDTDTIKSYVDEMGAASAAVIGGGFVGVEMAENLRERGLRVTLAEAAPHILAPFDSDMSAMLEKELAENGVQLILGDGVKAFQENGQQVEITLNSNTKLKADFVILAIGVAPETAFLSGSGVELGPRGHILVNENMETNIKDVYAVGDAVEAVDYVTGQKTVVPLAGPANKQGRIAADNAAGLHSVYKGTQGSSILKVFNLTGAATGANERTLQRVKIPYKTVYVHPVSHASYYPGALIMSLKLLFGEDGRVLGAQGVGYEGVDKRIDVIASVIRFHGTVDDLAELELAYAPPYSSAKDPVNMVGFAAQNVLAGMANILEWKDLQRFSEEEYILLDVRSELEYNTGYAEGSVNIPLDELRQRLGELDRSKTILVYCQVGLRGYIAERMLTHNGLKAYNITGGYKTLLSLQYNPAMMDAASAIDPGNAAAVLDPDTQSLRMTDTDPNRSMGIEKSIVTDNSSTMDKSSVVNGNTVMAQYDKELDACGLCCPGPLMQVKAGIDGLRDGQVLKVTASDPGFYEDVRSWCKGSGNELLNRKKDGGNITAFIRKGVRIGNPNSMSAAKASMLPVRDNKTMVVFSGDLDKAIASFIIANGAASMGKKVTMFFTFWGLNILRKPEKVPVQKGVVERMFGFMMPRGSKKLKLSNMNMMGMGGLMIRKVMKDKNVSSLEELIQAAIHSGIEIVACQMSMDVMGLKQEELIDGVKIGGVGYYLGEAEDSNVNLFI
jgi:NADPH-dependent 2,4-dienoyl-CoA reductase/sulfur reductase-like enzyme/peroxiredoxin family protein/TusA-related sulfurtransferase/rhodanese-related sulfurtransferase